MHGNTLLEEQKRKPGDKVKKQKRCFIKSLFWNVKTPDKTNFDQPELPNLAPKEIFSNVGALSWKMAGDH